jgi:biotin carboxyl carrier protein
MHVALRHKQQLITVDLQFEGGTYRATVDGTEYVVEAQHLDDATLSLVIDGRRYRVDLARHGRECSVAVGGEVYIFVPETGGISAHSMANVAAPEVIAPMPGKVLQIAVQPGDHVAAGDTLLILEAMKMETRLTAEAAASVAEVRVAAGDMVNGGQVLVVLSYDES